MAVFSSLRPLARQLANTAGLQVTRGILLIILVILILIIIPLLALLATDGPCREGGRGGGGG